MKDELDDFQTNLPATRPATGRDRLVPGSATEVLARLEQKYGRSPSGLGMAFLLVDCSSSMSGNKLEQARTGAFEFADVAIHGNYEVGLISFDSGAGLLSEPTTDVPALRAAMDRLRAMGSTNMAAALSLASQHLDDARPARAVVLATDGYPDSRSDTERAADALKARGVEIHTVMTEDADVAFLSRLATRSDLATVAKPHELRAAIAAAASKLQLPKPK
jgi:Mg-chelatase subunit ChlD